MSDKLPYVHKYTVTLEVMPLLAQSCNAVVFDVIGLLEPERPEGVTEQDLANYISRGLATLRAALASLLSNGLLEAVSEGHYRTNGRYMRYGKRPQEASPSEIQKYIFEPIVVVDPIDYTNGIQLKEQQQQAREILRTCGIVGKPLTRLSEKVTGEIAEAWRDWLQTAPSNLRSPVGIMVAALLADPTATPPTNGEPSRTRKPYISGKLAQKAA